VALDRSKLHFIVPFLARTQRLFYTAQVERFLVECAFGNALFSRWLLFHMVNLHVGDGWAMPQKAVQILPVLVKFSDIVMPFAMTGQELPSFRPGKSQLFPHMTSG